jgi:drug/metabolite transporter (DMT)-like permease
MKLLDALKEEVVKAPIGTIGAICGAITLVRDIAIAVSPETHNNLSSKEQFAIAILKSIVICFIFAFVPARFLDISRLSTKILYVIFAIVAALFINIQFGIYFAASHTFGGAGDIIMVSVGSLMSCFYAYIFIETSNRDTNNILLKNYDIPAMIAIGIAQTMVIASGLYLPVD